MVAKNLTLSLETQILKKLFFLLVFKLALDFIPLTSTDGFASNLLQPPEPQLSFTHLGHVKCLGRPYHFKFFKDCLPQILLGPFLNT